MACTHTKNCELFGQFALNPVLKVWQVHYCDADYLKCQRYQLSLQRKPVPINLLPNGQLLSAPESAEGYAALALFNAIMKDRAFLVSSLLRTAIDVNARNSDGTSPLMAAASRGNAEIVKMLLDKGADPAVVNARGETARVIAERAGQAEVARLLAESEKRPAKRRGLFGFLRRSA